MANTWVVATDGNDTTGTGSSLNPWRTIGKGAAAAAPGDTVLVKGDPAGIAVYNETVTFNTSSVHFLGDTIRPVLDGGGVRGAGFTTSAGPNNVTIENFEIRNYKTHGVLGFASKGQQHHCTIKSCFIHHIKPPKPDTLYQYSYGCYLAYGDWHVIDCEIAYISGWNESTGIWFGYCNNHVADGNLIYSVRKEGIRDYMGNLARIVNNVIFLCWAGLEPNESAQGLWANNYVYHCQMGINPKHTNDPGRYNPHTGVILPVSWVVMGYWGLDRDDPDLKWVRMWHNTMHRNCWGHLVHAIDNNFDNDGVNGATGYTTQADVRNNIFSGKCGAFFWDWPAVRLAPNIVDYNCYSTAALGPSPGQVHPVWQTDWFFNMAANMKTLAQLRTDLGFELNGMQLDPQLNDPDNGDLDYQDSSPVHNAGIDLTSLGSEWGQQMGARGLDARLVYTSHIMARVDSLNPPFGAGAADENIFTNNNDSSIPYDGTNPLFTTFDFGSEKTFNHVRTDVQRHAAQWNPKRVRVDGSNVSASGPWTPVVDDQVYDAGGTGWNVGIPTDQTYRYVRYTAYPFGGTYIQTDDIRIGYISPGVIAAPDTTPPDVSLDSPLPGEVTGREVTMSATASDDTHVARVEFYSDDVLIGSVFAEPFDFTWETTPADVGVRVIHAVAYDDAGNSAISTSATIGVSTGGGSIPGVADVTLNTELPEGTTVEVHPSSQMVDGQSAPIGAATTTATVGAQGVVTLLGLTEGASYVLYTVFNSADWLLRFVVDSGPLFVGDFAEGQVPVWDATLERFVPGNLS